MRIKLKAETVASMYWLFNHIMQHSGPEYMGFIYQQSNEMLVRSDIWG